MEENLNNKPKEVGNKKRGLKIFIILVILGVLTYSFFWLKAVKKRDLHAREVINNSEAYLELKTKVSDEKNRCSEFISQKTGDFGDFEYCKRFLDFTFE